jgi:tetratricopeptide (TPR) repeat protein
MKKLKNIFLLSLVIGRLVFPAVVHADDDAGTDNLFLLGTDARALGMGGAYVSVADGASSIYWNPAGLALLERGEATFMHVSLWEETIYDFLGLAYPTLEIGSMGVGVFRLGSTDIPKTDANNPGLQIGTFDNTQTLYIFSVASSFPLYTKGGVSVKVYNHSIDGKSATGVGLDLGILATPNEHFSWGLNLQDLLQPEIKLENSEVRIPFNLKAGVSFTQKLEWFSLILAADLDKSKGREIQPHFGSEIGIQDALFLRGGYDRGYGTFGAGVKWNWVRADYAFKANPDLGATHRFSATVQFGRSVESRRSAQHQVGLKQMESSRRQETQEQISSYLKEARTRDQKGDYLDALESYNKILALDPDNPAAVKRSEFLKRQISESSRPQTELSSGRLLAEASLVAAEELYHKGSYRLALERAEEVLKTNPHNSEALNLHSQIKSALNARVAQLSAQAKTHQQTGKLEQAILLWAQVLALDSTNLSAQAGLQQAGQQVKLNAHIRSGVEYYNSGSYSAAWQEFQAAFKINPQDPMVIDYLQQVNSRLVKPTTLEDLKRDTQIWQLYQQGLDKYQKGDYRGAVEAWQEVLKVYPNNKNTLRNIEQAKLRLK